MAKKLHFLLLMLLCFLFAPLIISADTEWVGYGGNQTTDGIVGANTLGITSGGSISIVTNGIVSIPNYTIPYGTNSQILVSDIMGDSNQEGIMWADGSSAPLRIIDLQDSGTILNAGTSTLQLKGQPAIINGKYVGIFLNTTNDVMFGIWNLTSNPIRLEYSYIMGTEGSNFNNVSLSCGSAFNQNRCIFMTQNTSIFNFNVDDHSLFYFDDANLRPSVSTTNNVLQPAVIDLHKDGGLDAVFVARANLSNVVRVYAMVYEVFGNTMNTGFSTDGYVITSASAQNIGLPPLVTDLSSSTSPSVENFIFAPFFSNGGSSDGAVAQINPSGTIVQTANIGEARVSSLAVITTDKIDPSSVRGIYALSGSDSIGAPNIHGRFFNLNAQTSTGVTSLTGLQNSPIQWANPIATADINGDGIQEVITSYTLSGGASTRVSALNSSNLSDSIATLFNDGSARKFYISVVDFNHDNQTDILLTATGRTIIYASNGTGSGGANTAPTITSVTPSTPSPVNKGTNVFFTYVATDPELDSIYGAVKCESSDSYGSFSSANAGETSHDPCAYTTIGCKTATIAVTDNEAGRLTSVTPTSWTTSSSTQFLDKNLSVRYYCGDGNCNVNEDHTSCVIDCTISTCGDTTCQATETSLTCPVDCLSATCGDATCDLVENYVSCPADCSISTCGDGVCSYPENTTNCPYDTFEFGTGSCGDTFCDGTETFSSCPADCTLITCGNNICGTGENTTSCPYDCGTCGNGVCEGQESSLNSPSYCVADCPSTDIEIPLQLVNPDNLEEGLLPELYYGIRAFFSPFLIPLIGILIFLMIAMVFWAIATKLKQMGG